MSVERQQGGRDKLTTPRHDQLGKAEPDLERFEEPQADTASDQIRALTQASHSLWCKTAETAVVRRTYARWCGRRGAARTPPTRLVRSRYL